MLINPTTSPAAAAVKLRFGGTITAIGDLGSDEIAVKVKGSQINTWVPLIEDSKAVVLTGTQMSLAAKGALYIQVDKPATAVVVGVEVG